MDQISLNLTYDTAAIVLLVHRLVLLREEPKPTGSGGQPSIPRLDTLQRTIRDPTSQSRIPPSPYKRVKKDKTSKEKMKNFFAGPSTGVKAGQFAFIGSKREERHQKKRVVLPMRKEPAGQTHHRDRGNCSTQRQRGGIAAAG